MLAAKRVLAEALDVTLVRDSCSVTARLLAVVHDSERRLRGARARDDVSLWKEVLLERAAWLMQRATQSSRRKQQQPARLPQLQHRRRLLLQQRRPRRSTCETALMRPTSLLTCA